MKIFLWTPIVVGWFLSAYKEHGFVIGTLIMLIGGFPMIVGSIMADLCVFLPLGIIHHIFWRND